MVDSLKKPGFEEIRPGVKAPAKETLLTPRFYTTDFDEMARMDLSVNEDELNSILEEFRADYNRHHFVRDAEFEKSWDHIDGETRKLFVEFLERSCTAEFSGFSTFSDFGRAEKCACVGPRRCHGAGYDGGASRRRTPARGGRAIRTPLGDGLLAGWRPSR